MTDDVVIRLAEALDLADEVGPVLLAMPTALESLLTHAKWLRERNEELERKLAGAVVLPPDAQQRLRTVASDPGAWCIREHGEALHRWVARAVLVQLSQWRMPGVLREVSAGPSLEVREFLASDALRDDLTRALRDEQQRADHARVDEECGEQFACARHLPEGDPPCGVCPACAHMRVVASYHDDAAWARFRARAVALIAHVREEMERRAERVERRVRRAERERRLSEVEGS